MALAIRKEEENEIHFMIIFQAKACRRRGHAQWTESFQIRFDGMSEKCHFNLITNESNYTIYLCDDKKRCPISVCWWCWWWCWCWCVMFFFSFVATISSEGVICWRVAMGAYDGMRPILRLLMYFCLDWNNHRIDIYLYVAILFVPPTCTQRGLPEPISRWHFVSSTYSSVGMPVM